MRVAFVERLRRFLLAGTAALLSTHGSHAMAACKMQAVLNLPVTMVGTQPLVTVKLNGTEAHLVMDTGSTFTIVAPETAKRAGLVVGPAPSNLIIEGIGGSARPDLTSVKEFGIGTQTLKRVALLVYGDRLSNGSIDGILGQNFLRLGDIEIDLANGMARLFKTSGCDHANLAYWSDAAKVGELDIRPTDEHLAMVIGKAQVNGTDIGVMIDSGAYLSALSLHAAQRAGITPQSPGVTPGGIRYGVGSGMRDSWIAPFRSFKLDTEEVQNTHLRISDMGVMPPNVDMLLGADFLLSHHIIISYRLDKLFFTYNGGPVFDLSTPRSAPAGASTAASGSHPTTPATTAAASAADIDRRAGASEARGELSAALADFGRAIEAEPENAQYRLHRGEARVRAGDLQAALADADEAVRLQAGYTEALMFRARLRLRTDQLEAAQADFAAAEASAPARYELPLQEADLYAGAGRYPLALALLNRWIAAHPQDERHYDAMNERCLVRGMLGIELDAALADCNTVRRHVSTNSLVLFNRGIVQLRRKQYDKAISDFNDALQLQPRLARAMYARGLARMAQGDRAGSADLQAALVLEPKVAQQFRDVDLGP
jgi:tetratricopeptide (TPR) repeat protein/predicted aspartyl protease